MVEISPFDPIFNRQELPVDNSALQKLKTGQALQHMKTQGQLANTQLSGDLQNRNNISNRFMAANIHPDALDRFTQLEQARNSALALEGANTVNAATSGGVRIPLPPKGTVAPPFHLQNVPDQGFKSGFALKGEAQAAAANKSDSSVNTSTGFDDLLLPDGTRIGATKRSRKGGAEVKGQLKNSEHARNQAKAVTGAANERTGISPSAQQQQQSGQLSRAHAFFAKKFPEATEIIGLRHLGNQVEATLVINGQKVKKSLGIN
jgi:hypothetical protein